MTYNVFVGTLNLTQSILFCHASGVKEKGIENVSDVRIGSIMSSAQQWCVCRVFVWKEHAHTIDFYRVSLQLAVSKYQSS